MARALVVLLSVCVSRTASAEPLPLPSPLPSGYTLEHDGVMRLVYPTAAESEIAALKRMHGSAWATLEHEFGLILPGEIDLRVAVNPEQMQALVPSQALPRYASGVALPQHGLVLLSMTEQQQFFRPDLERVFVHELSHLALQRAVADAPVPRWFAEGVAIHQADEHSIARVRVLWEGTLRGDLLSLDQLSRGFPAEHGAVDLAYAEAADLVGHMLDGPRGPTRFRTLIAHLRAREPFDRAVASAYGMSLVELEHAWRQQLAQRFGRWPSILSGLTLIWVLGAVLLVVGYVRVRRRHKETLKRWEIEEAPMLAMEAAALPVAPPPAPATRHVADDVLDAWGEQRGKDPAVPTIVHEGRSYTLH